MLSSLHVHIHVRRPTCSRAWRLDQRAENSSIVTNAATYVPGKAVLAPCDVPNAILTRFFIYEQSVPAVIRNGVIGDRHIVYNPTICLD